MTSEAAGAALAAARELSGTVCRLSFALYDEALAVADSALREGFPEWQLAQAAREARGPRASRIKLIGRLADGRAA